MFANTIKWNRRCLKEWISSILRYGDESRDDCKISVTNEDEHDINDISMSAVATDESGQPVQKGTLLYFHLR